MSLRMILSATALGIALIASGPASADPKHCPPGHAKKGWCTPGGHYRGDRRSERRWERRERREDRRRQRDAYEQGYEDGLRDGWRRGEYIPRDRYRILDDWDDYGWRRPGPDEYYVIVDGRYYLIEAATGLILDLLTR